MPINSPEHFNFGSILAFLLHFFLSNEIYTKIGFFSNFKGFFSANGCLHSLYFLNTQNYMHRERKHIKCAKKKDMYIFSSCWFVLDISDLVKPKVILSLSNEMKKQYFVEWLQNP